LKPPLDFWFDFISPFGYLASLRIDAIAERHCRTVQWRPLLLGVTVLKVMGLPAVPQTPLKGPYAGRQIARYLRQHSLTLARDPAATPMNPLPAGRLFAWLRVHASEHAKPVARAILDANWVQDRAMDDRDALREVALLRIAIDLRTILPRRSRAMTAPQRPLPFDRDSRMHGVGQIAVIEDLDRVRLGLPVPRGLRTFTRRRSTTSRRSAIERPLLQSGYRRSLPPRGAVLESRR
jgi:2-hydroxychromene-2-carboxylate isomerase